MFATRTKNEQSTSLNIVNFIDLIPAYAGMTKKKKRVISIVGRVRVNVTPKTQSAFIKKR